MQRSALKWNNIITYIVLNITIKPLSGFSTLTFPVGVWWGDLSFVLHSISPKGSHSFVCVQAGAGSLPLSFCVSFFLLPILSNPPSYSTQVYSFPPSLALSLLYSFTPFFKAGPHVQSLIVILHDDKFDDKTDTKIASTWYSSTCPAYTVLLKFCTYFSENFNNKITEHNRIY